MLKKKTIAARNAGFSLSCILASLLIILLFLSERNRVFGAAESTDQETILMLEGNSCVFHPEEIKKALSGVLGVKSIDLEKMPGHALVIHDQKVHPETLLDAIKETKGENDQEGSWFCIADLMKLGE